MTFRVSIPLRWSDYDVAGHVNNVVYLSYIEHARTMLLGSVLGPDVYVRPNQVLRAQQIEYLRPLTLSDSPVEVVVTRYRLGTTSYTLDYRVVSPLGEHAAALCTVVTIDPASGRAAPLPAVLRSALEGLTHTESAHMIEEGVDGG